jgi:flagellar biosynthesis protein FlhF
MKMKRFQAEDMRQALRQVRETLGADAVILSNRKTEDGIELVAAVDFDESALRQNEPVRAQAPKKPRHRPDLSAVEGLDAKADWRVQVPPRPASVAPPGPQMAVAAEKTKRESSDWSAEVDDDFLSLSARARAPEPDVSRPEPKVRPQLKAVRPAAEVKPSAPDMMGDAKEDQALRQMREEMAEMRRLMQGEFSLLGWGEMGRSNPQAQTLFRRLMALELSSDLCHGLVKKVGDYSDLEQAWRRALGILAASLPLYQPKLLDEGGVVALVGPTGVGKTTTIAKIAARFSLRHGNRHLGLISADGYRLGAHDQLAGFGRLLDVPVRRVNSGKEMQAALDEFRNKRLVLIDTAGMGQRDAHLEEQLAMLKPQGHAVNVLLALASSTQQSALEQCIQAFRPVNPEGCVITKADEATALGGVFSAMIRRGLPLAFVTDGQKVPEDMHLPRPQALVNRAVNMSQQYGISQSDQYLAYTLGGLAAEARA